MLSDGKPARNAEIPAGRGKQFRMLQLLTAKPVLYICNVGEAEAATGNSHSDRVRQRADRLGAATVVISAAIEAEVALLEEDAERAEFLQSLGLEEPGLARVIRAGYDLLHLITLFTTGPK